MEKLYMLPFKKITFIAGIILLSIKVVKAQSPAVYIPYSYQLDQKFNSTVYSIGNSDHTALKPYLLDSALNQAYNAIMQRTIDTTRKHWIPRKIFNEHLFDIQNKEYTFYGDYLTDFGTGKDLANHVNTYINTRGYQFGGTVGDKFFFYTSGYENQGKFPLYYTTDIDKIGFVPGQAYSRSFATPDWSYGTTILSYTFNKHYNITLGEDKTFIGDGYRSLLLSDFAANYPLLRLTGNWGKFQYMMMWAYLEDINLPKFDSFGSNRRKWAAFHYLDYNVNNRLSFGFFNAVIVPEADDNGNFHSFDPNYVNPVLFLNALNSNPSQPDNTLIGFTGKYKIFDKTAIYAQLLLDRFDASTFFSGGSNSNTNGLQLGIRGADLFNVTHLNYLLEFNTVRPYTYQGQQNNSKPSEQSVSSYTEYSEPLGDPLGANFREFIGILNYQAGRFDFMGQLNYSKSGLDPTGEDYGQNVTIPYIASSTPTTVGQGIATNLIYAQGTVGLIINPKTNLRLELGGIYRYQTNSLGNNKTAWVTFGIRSSFRGLYSDF